MFALLGLPEARRLGPEVSAIERELVALTVASTAENPDLNANHDLLQALTTLAARLEAGAAGSIYRFGASRAYAEIVRGRLEAIAEQPRSGYLSFSGFLARRLGPAMLTCTTMEDRQAMLSRKLARAAQLLRTRVDIELEHQNRDLLLALNTRTRLQLRLQQTVEALSIAAASYYVVGLIGHAMDALPRVGIRIDPTLATALSVPIVVLGIGALFIVRLRAVDEEAVQEAEAHARPPARPAVSGPG
jgi:uncharacterized membrane-anchored protein